MLSEKPTSLHPTLSSRASEGPQSWGSAEDFRKLEDLRGLAPFLKQHPLTPDLAVSYSFITMDVPGRSVRCLSPPLGGKRPEGRMLLAHWYVPGTQKGV